MVRVHPVDHLVPLADGGLLVVAGDVVPGDAVARVHAVQVGQAVLGAALAALGIVGLAHAGEPAREE